MFRIWNQSLHPPSKDLEEIAKWEHDYQQVLQAHREEIEGLRDADFDYGADIQRAWEQRYGRGLTADMNERQDTDRPFFDPLGVPNLPEYTFGTSPLDVGYIIKRERLFTWGFLPATQNKTTRTWPLLKGPF